MGVGSWPLEAARDAMACRRVAAMSGFATGGTAGAAADPVPGLLYMESIVGRRAAPNGVDRKSVGRSICFVNSHSKLFDVKMACL